MTKNEITKLMALISVEYAGRFDVTEERVTVWENILRSFDYRDGQAGVLQAIGASGQWPPTVGEVRAKINDARKERARLELRAHDSRRLIDHRDEAAIAKGRELLRDCVLKITSKGAA
jgi:hypothetical protein